jgi:hypothetical protein
MPRNIAVALRHWSRGWDMAENVPDINAVIEKNLADFKKPGVLSVRPVSRSLTTG